MTAASSGLHTPGGVDTHLSILLPDLRMLSTKNFGIKVAVSFGGNCLRVCLSTDLYALIIDEGYMLRNKRIVERVKIECGVWYRAVGGREGRHRARRRRQRR